MIIHLAVDPLPYSPLRIVDTSPFHSSLSAHDASKPRPRRWAPRVAAAGIVTGLALLAGTGSPASGIAGQGEGQFGFQMGPGNAMPPSLVAASASTSVGDVRLAPGNAMPIALAPSVVSGFALAPGNAMPAALER